MITKKEYLKAGEIVDTYEEQELTAASEIAEQIQKDVRNYTEDQYWEVEANLDWEGDVRYSVTNGVTYDEDYGGEYNDYIEDELGIKYGVKIYVTGIYGK